MIRLLIADDSSFIRLVLSDMLSGEPGFLVVDVAANGKEAWEKTLQHKPDLVLLDLVMDKYDGFYALERIMADYPVPVIVITGTGYAHPELMRKALEKGAVDFIHKPQGLRGGGLRNAKASLVQKINQILAQNKNPVPQGPVRWSVSQPSYQVIAMGGSTGGIEALEVILKVLPNFCPLPILIAQHMPGGFIKNLASRLTAQTGHHCRVAQAGEVILPGVVYFMPAESLQVARAKDQGLYFEPVTDLAFAGQSPSIDALFTTVARTCADESIGVLLSGMGTDGTKGLGAIQQKGGNTIALDQADCLVYGMPRAAIEAGYVAHVLTAIQIAEHLVVKLEGRSSKEMN